MRISLIKFNGRSSLSVTANVHPPPHPEVTLQRITDVFITSLTERPSCGSRSQGPRRWERAFTPHLLFIVNFLPRNRPQKCKVTAAKLSRKLTGPGVAGDAGDPPRPGRSTLVFSLIYRACIAEPATQSESPRGRGKGEDKKREGCNRG